VPYIYEPSEIQALLAAARGLTSPLRAASCATLLGLIAATGMRLGEALALTRDDVDLAQGMLTIRHAKFDRMRLVPVHGSVVRELSRYAATRDRIRPVSRCDRFFISPAGTPLRAGEIETTFRQLTSTIGLRTDAVHPRIHDLRHTFAVRTLIGWQREQVDVSAWLPVLSTYLGHVEPANTYWYLTAVPELMQLVAARLEPEPTASR
jgi:integrase